MERSHGFSKFMYKFNQRDLSATKTSFLRKLISALALIFRDNYAKSRHNYRLEMGNVLLYFCAKVYSFVVLLDTRYLSTSTIWVIIVFVFSNVLI